MDWIRIPAAPEDSSRTERRVMWTVSVYRRSGDTEVHEYTSHRLDSPGLAREHARLARERPWVSRVALTEHVREVSRRTIGEEGLPVRSLPPRRVPERPGGRLVAHFYEIEGLEGAGELSADDVRCHLYWLREAAASTRPPEGAGAKNASATLWEVAVVDVDRPTTEDALPHTPSDP
ncbi:hypothetical protein [Streptomyces violascens]|uniref:hypothetical protein n=1 Tax=Streptomyces violascens TaxID=67381 RepID=UPI0016755CAE|nr:hypothetical protein [Streptomyces violascens]GGU49478.1 hypothetical protein GCM10010289_82500 [Streptomyces violascens]